MADNKLHTCTKAVCSLSEYEFFSVHAELRLVKVPVSGALASLLGWVLSINIIKAYVKCQNCGLITGLILITAQVHV